MLGVAVVAAGTGVHRRHQHDAGRIGEGGGDPCDGDPPIFQGLAQDLQDILLELWQLIQEEDPVVGEAHLPRFRYLPPSDEPCIGDGMMG